MTITICDDETVQRENLRAVILEQYPDMKILECRKAEEAVGCAAESDMMLLDIDTGTEMDGMAAARTIYNRREEEGRLYSLPLIIFITGFPERMREAFGVHAFHFLEKPVKRQVLLPVLKEAVSVVEKILTEDDKPSAENSLMIKNGDQVFLVPFRMIVYVESSGRLQHIHVSGQYRGQQEEEVIYPGSMDDLELQLPKSFYRIHRGFIVNMRYIVGYAKTGVELSDGSQLLISRYKYKEFVEKYFHFAGFGE